VIEIRKEGNMFAAWAVLAGGNVKLFNACFYETAVDQAFVRDGRVRFNGYMLEKPKKERRVSWGKERERERRELRRVK
jgi:hypothetical protein